MSLLYETAVQEDLNVGVSTASVTMPSGGSRTGTQIGIHSVGVGQVAWTVSWNPGSIAAAGYEAKDVTVPGAVVGDFAIASLTTILTNDMMLTAQVSAADTVTAILFNPTAGAINLGAGSLSILVFKSR